VRAVRFHGAGDVRVDVVQTPGPAGPGEVMVRVLACGVCGSDALEYRQGPVLIHPLDRVHPVTGHRGPLVLGHEFAGEVVDVGPGVDRLSDGMLVACGAGMSCGVCVPCRAGRTNLCERYATIGFHRDGGLAEYCASPASICFDAGEHRLTPDAAALAQPMSIAVHATRRGRCDDAREVLVIGAGGIGAFITYVCASWGARVTVCDIEAQRLELARGLGAEHVASSPAELDLKPEVILEASGAASALAEAIEIAPRGGRVVAVGLQKRPPELDLRRITLDEIELIGTVAHTAATDMPEALRLLAMRAGGWEDVAPAALPLELAVAEGLAPLAEGRSTRVKTLIDPWADRARASQTGVQLAEV
jgi:(R,R)-butanediol dehydrogenase / meso-butanediol dehydrogenase / diacetyl reductase